MPLLKYHQRTLDFLGRKSMEDAEKKAGLKRIV